MSFTHTIVHPTDFSPPSAKAFELACALAHEQGARLIVLYVLPPPTSHGEVVARRQEDFSPDLWNELRSIRDPADAVHVEHWLRSGDVVEEIVDAAKESGCKLIVVGTHGRGGVGRVLMGSVAEKLLRSAPCPVVTLKATPGADAHTKLAHVETILHPTDFSADSEAAFRLACSLAKDFGAAVQVLHVGAPPLVSPIMGVVPVAPERLREDLTAQLKSIVAPAPVRVTHQLIFKSDTGGAILKAAEATKADLIVMGTHGRSGARRLLLGSVAEHVVRNAVCPVLTVKGETGAEHAAAGRPVGARG
jgi:nucleotide-binding universal stress UspA family protein